MGRVGQGREGWDGKMGRVGWGNGREGHDLCEWPVNLIVTIL